MTKKIYTLSKVTRAIEKVISQVGDRSFWVKAEIVKLNYYQYSGHCYPDLVEKNGDKIVAQIRGTIWKSNFTWINRKFRDTLNEDLGDHMTVVLKANVKYDSVHGLSLNITDIDPAYTLGELARQKAETIIRLKKEQLFDANKRMVLPLLPKTIAIISVSTSKGYQDFIDVIENNEWGYRYHYLLFPAILQGEKAISTIGNRLGQIKKYSGLFDAVAIIRGGGGEIGLSSYDNYQLAKSIATFPLPVLTGIGHAANETVTEMVSYRSFITPTKMAEFLLQAFHQFRNPLEQSAEKIKNQVWFELDMQKSNIRETARLFASLTSSVFENQNHLLNHRKQSLVNLANAMINFNFNAVKTRIMALRNHSEKMLQWHETELNRAFGALMLTARQRVGQCDHEMDLVQTKLLSLSRHVVDKNAGALNNLEEKTALLSPQKVLQRGYSITRINNRAVKAATDIHPGDLIETELFSGKMDSRVEKIKNK